MAADNNHLPTIWRLRQVLEQTGLSRSSMYELIAVGRFPQPVALGARAVGWRSDEVISWIMALPRAASDRDGLMQS